MEFNIIDFIPEKLLFIIFIAMLLFNFFIFIKAPKVERLLENRKFKYLRRLTNEVYIFLIVTAFATSLPVVNFTNNVIYFFLSLPFFILSLLFAKQTKSKYIISIKRFKMVINVSIFRFINYFILITLLFFQYYTFLCVYTYSEKDFYKIANKSIIDAFVIISNGNIVTLLYFLFAALVFYFILRLYLHPMFVYYYSKPSNHYADIVLIDGSSILNVKIINIFHDYYVLSPSDCDSNNITNKYVIAKDKIKYIKLRTNNNIT